MVLPVFTGEKQERKFSVDQSFDIVFQENNRISWQFASDPGKSPCLAISVVIIKKFSDGN